MNGNMTRGKQFCSAFKRERDNSESHWNSKVKEETTGYLYEGSKISINSFARALSNLCDDKGIAISHQNDIIKTFYTMHVGNK